VIAAHPDLARGSELDPAQLRARREKLIARAAELLPRQPSAPQPGADLAAQLKQAMRQNAFGDLRFSGRDPVEMIDELRASWAEVGPMFDDEDRAQRARFDDIVQRVLDAAGVKARPDAGGDRAAREARGDERGGRRRRDRRGGEPAAGDDARDRMRASEEIAVIAAPIELEAERDARPAAAVAASVIDTPTAPSSIPISAHDAITVPVSVPQQPAPDAPDAPEALEVAEREPQAEQAEASAAVDEAEPGWDLGDEDPTASDKPDKPEVTTPSSSEMAGDGAVEGDGIDSGWD
jgi:hypothetical protein